MKHFLSIITSLLPASAPLLLATLGALVSEHAGVLAVFMDGAITIAAFICVAVTWATGSSILGFMLAVCGTVLFLSVIAFFTEKTKANPFITALSVNLLSQGLCSFFSVILFGTRGTFAIETLKPFYFSRHLFFPYAFISVIFVSFFLYKTQTGIRIRAVGSSAEALRVRGLNPAIYRSLSWVIAAFFAASAGTMLSLDLGAWVPNVSAGRGWTALAAVYLGYKNPYLCALAVFAFTGAEYATYILQGLGKVPATLILGLPYALALLVFILIRDK